MEVNEACHLICTMMFKPGWRLSAVPYRHGTVKITFVFASMDSSHPSPDGQYHRAGVFAPELELDVSKIEDGPGLIHGVIQKALEIEAHEMREFAREYPAQPAPLHPHTDAGNEAWARHESVRVVEQIMELMSLWGTY